jgi:nitroreductase
MDVENAILNRRSVRNYKSDKSVSNETIAEILDLARFAPSSGNLQNWKVILVSDPGRKEELATAALKQKWITTSPVLLAICNNKADVKRLYKDRGESLYSIQNVAVFTNNILLAAHNLGLSTCWIGAFDPDAVKMVLRLPEGVEPEAIIALGYAAEELEAPSRKTIDQFTFFETWGNVEKSFNVFEKGKAKIGEVKSKGKGFFSKIFGKKKD